MNELGIYMPFIQWEKAFSVNIESIDNQHQKLVDMINELHDSVSKGSSRERLNEAFLRFSVYTVKHFIYEENLFKKYGYKDQDKHKKEHDDLAERLTEFHKKFSMQKEDISDDLLEFFKDIMFDHIVKFDQRYIEYMSSNKIH